MTEYHSIDIGGLNIFYREAGRRDRPTLLLLHGFPASSFMYRHLLERLADRFHLVAPDYPGFGYSEAPSPADYPYTFDALADTMLRFAERLDLQRFGLYMQDFGGPVGLRLASAQPKSVSFLVVQNANAYDEGLPDSFWAPLRQLWSDPSPANLARIRAAGMSDDALQWNYTHGAKHRQRVSPDSWALQRALLERPGNKDIMLALLRDYGSNPGRYAQWQAYFREHQPPTLVVWGKNDVIFPESGAHPYRRDLKKIETHILDAGHFALEDHADVIAAHIRRFADTLD
jgi:pimeloyl-ACP methyl ester carboxylesterase